MNDLSGKELIQENTFLKKRIMELESLATEHRLMEEALRASELRYQTYFETTGTCMLIIEEDMTVSLASKGFESLTGYTRQEVEGKRRWTDFVDKDDVEKMVAHHRSRRLEPNHIVKSYEFRLVHKDGSLRNILLTVDLIPGTTSSIASLIDITDRKQVEEALEESEKKYRQLFMNAPAAIYEVDYKTRRYISLNDIIPSLTGYSREELMQMDPWDLFTEESQKTYLDRMRLMKEGVDVSTSQEYSLRKKDGSIMWVNTNIDYVMEEGLPVKARIVAHDITDRRRLEEALKASEMRFRRIAENAQDLIYRMSLPDGKYEYVSPASVAITGYAPDEFYANPLLIRKVIHPDWSDFFSQEWENLKRGEMPPVYEFKIIHRSGEERWVYQRNVMVKNDNNRPIAIEGIVTDITKRKKDELELLESKQAAVRYLNIAAEIILALDEQGNIELLNESGHRLLGYEPGSLIGKSWFETCLPEGLQRDTRQYFERLRHGEATTVESHENSVITAHGEERIILWHNTVLKNTDSRFAGTLSSGEDITERKQSELEKERLLVELQQALAEIKTLSGLLPICSYCKKIRDDKGYWNQLESYISKHSEASFTHSICPECYEKELSKL